MFLFFAQIIIDITDFEGFDPPYNPPIAKFPPS